MSRSLRGTGRADGLLDLRMPTGAAASPLLLIVCYSIWFTGYYTDMACMIGRCFLDVFGIRSD